MTRKIPLSAMDRVLREITPARVSDSAKEALLQALEEKGREITKKASQIARHSGRNTIMKNDVNIAKK